MRSDEHKKLEIARHFAVLLELHRVGRTTLGHAAEVGGVAEHFAQRDISGDFFDDALVLGIEDHAATR